jgi:transcriptional regulator with XRE-family HTH domain
MGKPIEPCHAMVGMRIRQIREMLGISQDDLSKRVGLQRASVANVEIGRQRLLLDGVERYAKALGTTPKALMKGIWW